MKILHTADWHLGHKLHGHPRELEHQRFLDWLLETMVNHQADALIVAGDVFDSANPPASAQAMLYEFLANTLKTLPNLDIVILGGNHDSPSRLQAPDPILRHFNIRLLGSMPKSNGKPDSKSAVVPLTNAAGEVGAYLAAVPYLRPVDLPRGDGASATIPKAVGQLYAETFAAARRLTKPGQALLASGHCYMVGGCVSELSERRLTLGEEDAWSTDIFAGDVDYVALGHLHRAQRVGKADHIRYSGSPIPLSMVETDYEHQVCLVELAEKGISEIQEIPVPRTIRLIRLPEKSPKPLSQVLEALRKLRLDAKKPPELWPFLEVRVLLDKPDPDLRPRIEKALDDLPVRLVKITTEYRGTKRALADGAPEVELTELTEEEVFRRMYARDYESEPSKALLKAFQELVIAAKEALS